MKHILITTIAAVVLVGCGESQQSATPAEAQPVETVAEAATPELPTAKPPDISIREAVKIGNIEAVKQHLAAGADVNAKDDWGKTPLYVAALGGHKEIAELLIAKGADVNAKGDGGVTTLQLAASRGHKELAELLIAEGAEINAKDEDGHTPLHQAALDGQKEIAELLIAEGADVNAQRADGDTPLDSIYHIRGGKPETFTLLRKHGGKTGEELKAEGK